MQYFMKSENFFDYMKEGRNIIGKERSLHVQIISKECDEIVKEGQRTDDQVYKKVPVSYKMV